MTMEKGGTYPAGNLRAIIYDWRVGIAELKREYIICFRIPVNKSLIMMKIKLMDAEVTKEVKALIREYSEKAFGEYAKGIDSPDELFRDFGDAFTQLDRMRIDGKISNQFLLELYHDEFLRSSREVQFHTVYRDDIVMLLRDVSADMQDQENGYFERMDLARLAALRKAGNGERKVHKE